MSRDDELIDLGLDDVDPIHAAPINSQRAITINGKNYEQLDDVPEEIRPYFEQALQKASSQSPGSSTIRININGKEQLFERWEDVPAYLREQFSHLHSDPSTSVTKDQLKPLLRGTPNKDLKSSILQGSGRQRRVKNRAQINWYSTVPWLVAVSGTLYLIWYLLSYIMGVYSDAIGEIENQ